MTPKFQPITTLEQLDSHLAKYGIESSYFYQLADKRHPKYSNPVIADMLHDKFNYKPHSQTIGFWRKRYEDFTSDGQSNKNSTVEPSQL